MEHKKKNPNYIDYKRIAEKLTPEERIKLSKILMPDRYLDESGVVIEKAGAVSITAVQRFAHALRGDVPVFKVVGYKNTNNSIENNITSAVKEEVKKAVAEPVAINSKAEKPAPVIKEYRVTNNIPKRIKEMDEDKFLHITRNAEGIVATEEQLSLYGGTFNYVGTYQGKKYFEQLSAVVTG